MANRSKQLDDQALREVEMLAGLGLRLDDIAAVKGMSDDTLKKHAADSLKKGRANAKAQVMQTAFKMAISGKCPAMTIFWLKTRAGWSEKHSPDADVQAMAAENTIAQQLAINPEMLTTHELETLVEILARNQSPAAPTPPPVAKPYVDALLTNAKQAWEASEKPGFRIVFDPIHQGTPNEGEINI
jgi:DNA-binding CsgD family transcriptional regulator